VVVDALKFAIPVIQYAGGLLPLLLSLESDDETGFVDHRAIGRWTVVAVSLEPVLSLLGKSALAFRVFAVLDPLLLSDGVDLRAIVDEFVIGAALNDGALVFLPGLGVFEADLERIDAFEFGERCPEFVVVCLWSALCSFRPPSLLSNPAKRQRGAEIYSSPVLFSR
jgi:hypothetical protein